MQVKKILTQERLKILLNYDELTGIFTWKSDKLNGAIKAGDIAGSKVPTTAPYIGIDKKMYTTARLAWLYIYGEFPTEQIIRIDGNSNNVAKDNMRLRVRRTQEEREKRIEKDSRKLLNIVRWRF
jgi:hypothetical protein